MNNVNVNFITANLLIIYLLIKSFNAKSAE